MSVKIKARRDMRAEPVFDGDKTAIVTLARGESAEITAGPVTENAVSLIESPDGHRVGVYYNGKLFTEYVCDPKFAKPYLGPILLSNGESVTRLDFETKEHPHQRSLIIAVGEVNDVDFWNETPNHGIERPLSLRVNEKEGGRASFTAENVWEDANGRPVCDEARTFTFYAQPDPCRYIDLCVTFKASYGDVVFGATKEAGPLGIRVADTLRVDHGGRSYNSYGAENEAECWGRPASWCAYEGKVGGLDCGIAIFDGEDNERYPTAWHVRDYGLFAANNLFFKGGLTIKAGESLTYKYRILIYEGKCAVGDRFLNFAR